MSSEAVQDHLVNIKTFQTYLEHIVNSIESDRYHFDTIEKLSGCITSFYRDVNLGDDEDEDNDVEIIDSDENNSEVSAPDLSSILSNSSSSDTSDDDEDESLYLETFARTKKSEKKPDVVDKYFTEFQNREVNNEEFMLYKKNPELMELQKRYLKNITTY